MVDTEYQCKTMRGVKCDLHLVLHCKIYVKNHHTKRGPVFCKGEMHVWSNFSVFTSTPPYFMGHPVHIQTVKEFLSYTHKVILFKKLAIHYWKCVNEQDGVDSWCLHYKDYYGITVQYIIVYTILYSIDCMQYSPLEEQTSMILWWNKPAITCNGIIIIWPYLQIILWTFLVYTHYLRI